MLARFLAGAACAAGASAAALKTVIRAAQHAARSALTARSCELPAESRNSRTPKPHTRGARVGPIKS